VLTQKGEGRQWDTTIDLIWTNATAILDDTFQDLIINFTASEGSDHVGIWVTFHHILDLAINLVAQLPHYVISDESRDLWTCCFIEDSIFQPTDLILVDDVEEVVCHLTQDIESTCTNGII
jgi:hypothetical protein